MKRIAFDEEELLVLAFLEPDTRTNTIRTLEELLPEVEDDPDMEEILTGTAAKLKLISDPEFAELDLEPYREEADEEDEEDEEGADE